MIKSLSLVFVCLTFLNAQSIQLHHAKNNLKRISPTSSQAIYSYHDVLKEVTPSIVHIATTHTSQQNPQMQDFMQEFFGHRYRSPSPRKSTGLGSGVILSDDGYIVTNNHVIEKADEISVTLPEVSKTYKAKIIGSDPKSDIALIKIDVEEKLKPILLGDSSQLHVGDLVFAIGNPFGVGQSVTQGIISAQNKSGIGINEYENFIQTDASINPGNSGGALVDSRGVLIGINTAILSRSGGNNGIGFAIEVNMLKSVVQSLVEDGKVSRGFLGVQIDDLSENLYKLYTLKKGALIIDVTQDSAAEKAGLMRGDLITKVNEKVIKSASALKNTIGMLRPNSRVKISYERSKKSYTTWVNLRSQESIAISEKSMFAGLRLVNIDEKLRFKYRLPRDTQGVIVEGIDDNSQALSQGIRLGDVIVQVEEYKIRTLSDLKKALKMYKQKYKRVYIKRNGRIYLIALK